jgi:anti-sigma factor RsiW
MSRIFDPCGEYRENLSLLAAGALLPQECPTVENHLASCASCRKYYEEIQRVSVPLANWEQSFKHAEPTQATMARWEKDFAEAIAPAPRARFVILVSILDWVHDMIWPCRRIWAGFAAVWLVLAGVNVSTREYYQTFANGQRPSTEMVRAYLEAEGFLAVGAMPERSRTAKPQRHSSPPPRSERHSQILRG